jgi:predicted nucleic acid-binding protein
MSQGQATPTPLYIDTGGFYAGYVEDDSNHERAGAVFDTIRTGETYGPIFTSRYVLAELATVILYRKRHRCAVSSLEGNSGLGDDQRGSSNRGNV